MMSLATYLTTKDTSQLCSIWTNMIQAPQDLSMYEEPSFTQEGGSFFGIEPNPTLPPTPRELLTLYEPQLPHGQQPPAPELAPEQASQPAAQAPIQQPPGFILPPPQARGRSGQLTDFERLELLKICVNLLDVLRYETKTKWFGQASARFQIQLGRPYSATSIERQINGMTDLRREYLKTSVTGNAEGEHSEATPFIDEIIAVPNEISENEKEREEQANLRQRESQQDIEHRRLLTQGLSNPRKRKASQAQGQHQSTSPEPVFNPEEVLISTMSKISDAVIREDTTSQRISGLEDHYRHLEKTVSESKAAIEENQASLHRQEGILGAILEQLKQGKPTMG